MKYKLGAIKSKLYFMKYKLGYIVIINFLHLSFYVLPLFRYYHCALFITITTHAIGIVRQSRECVHSISEGSYCHTDALGEGDNLWSMIYPPAETNKDANLKKAPVAFDFSKILNNIKQYQQ